MDIIKIEGANWHFDRLPSECPLCHHAIDARHIASLVRSYEQFGTAEVELVFQCPRGACLRAFIGLYTGTREVSVSDHLMRLRATTPYTPEPPNHPSDVAALSPSFVSIFGQSSAAEAWGLPEIAGGGYRKALEFLIKDFCVSQHEAEADTITAMLLSQVINKYVSDANIKECAKRAAWLGNDETHYERRWADKDIKDLKVLIKLTVNWINSHLLTKKYLETMNG